MKKLITSICCMVMVTIHASSLTESLITKKKENKPQKLPLPHYEAQKFDLHATMKGFGKKQIARKQIKVIQPSKY